MQNDTEKLRLDKWLWAARFFKTRTLATDAIQGGKVRIGAQCERAKPSKTVRIGEQISIGTGVWARTVIVRVLSDQRRSASEAALLYNETEDSLARRETAKQHLRVGTIERAPGSGRPTKKDHRAIAHFTGKNTPS